MNKKIFKIGERILSFANGIHVCFSRLAIPLIFYIFFDVSGVDNSPLPGVILFFSVLSILNYFYPRRYRYE